jgi:hypothetical protein
MKKQTRVLRLNCRLARREWGELDRTTLSELRELLIAFRFSVALGDVQLIDGRWYVTHAGLLRLAQRRRCNGIASSLQKDLSSPTSSRWVFKATVYKTVGSRGFVGHGDADPSNTSPRVRGAEMRVAETRAVSRALRKAYGIGLCSVEELGSFSGPPKSLATPPHSNGYPTSNGSSNGQPRLRDQLCLLIRKYNLDPTLVKAYAADFCGTATLKEASRDLVEAFVSALADEAAKDRAALVCKLNSYTPQPEEVNS